MTCVRRPEGGAARPEVRVEMTSQARPSVKNEEEEVEAKCGHRHQNDLKNTVNR